MAKLFASFNADKDGGGDGGAAGEPTTLNSPVTFEGSHLEVEERELDDVAVFGPRSDKVHRTNEGQVPLERFRDTYRVLASDFAEKCTVAIWNE